MSITRVIFNSPSIMTWANLLARSSSLIILLPIILTTFNEEDIVIWYSYTTVLTLLMLIDLGFLPTFSRLFAYAHSGLSMSEIYDINNSVGVKSTQSNVETLSCLFSATKRVYLLLAVFSLLISLTIGSWFIHPIISQGSKPLEAWIAWVGICIISSITLYSNSYVSLLTGMDKVALIQRWQMISSLMAILTTSITIYLTHSLAIGVMVYFSWFLVNTFINWYLSKNIINFDTNIVTTNQVNQAIRNLIFPSAWRSGIGVISSAGIIQFSGLIVARLEDKSVAASYLFGLQIIRSVSNFSQAPFYSRLPYFSRLFAHKDFKTLLKVLKSKIKFSFIIYIVLFFLVGLSANFFLDIIGSNTKFVDMNLWILVGAAFLFERYGAMYIQIYTLTNHIVWHIANGITGLIMILVSLFLYNKLGIYAFALSMLIGYMCFYTPYSAVKVYNYFNLKFIKFEKDNFLLVIFAFMILSVILKLIEHL